MDVWEYGGMGAGNRKTLKPQLRTENRETSIFELGTGNWEPRIGNGKPKNIEHRTSNIEHRNMMHGACIIVLMALALTGCATAPSGDRWVSRDKAYHFLGGVVIGGGVTAISLNNGAGDAESIALGVAITGTLGAGKEAYDAHVRETYWSWKDMVWNLVGGAAGAVIVSAAE